MATKHWTINDLKDFKKQIDGWDTNLSRMFMNKADYDELKKWRKRTYNICG